MKDIVMKESNKPQWLIDAEQAMQEFEQSKYAQMTPTEFNTQMQIEDWTNKGLEAIEEFRKTDKFFEQQRQISHSVRSKHPNMSSNGGKKRAKEFTSEYQSKAAKSRTKEGIMRASLAGSAAAAKKAIEQTEQNKCKLYDLVPPQFTVNDLEQYLPQFPEFNDLQMFRSYLKDTSRYEHIGTQSNGKPGPAPKLYRKI